MSFAGALERQQEQVFARLGEDADWSGIVGAVRVRRIQRDVDADWGRNQSVARANFIKVRQSQVPAPTADDVVTLADTSELFKIIGTPKLDRKGVWTCEAIETAP